MSATDTADFRMPEVFVGDWVLWYAEASRASGGNPAQVLRVFNECVDLVLIGSSDMVPHKRSVRHLDDPLLWDDTRQDPGLRRRGGGWDYRERDKLDMARWKRLEESGIFAESPRKKTADKV